MRTFYLILTIACICSTAGIAQTVNQQSAWLFLMNTTKFSEKWGAHLDVQLRSADELKYVRNLLIRPGITYYINSKNDLTLGYLLNDTYNNVESPLENRLTEHRIWQQYVHKHKAGQVSISHRLRTEQRFIETTNGELFAQRFRYFMRGMLPLGPVEGQFSKGAFVALQNEAFIHLQNKTAPKVFDQNRAYVAAGYRTSPKADIEIGYMNQATPGNTSNIMNHIVQVALYTRF